MNTINNVKSLAIDMIDEAQSGHPGAALSTATILYTLYANHMHVNPKDTLWINRDRFVLSAGHASASLYVILYMAGFLTLKDLKEFRCINSTTPGHPEYKITPGVDMTTGPLGQGFAAAVGMAIAEKHLKQKFDGLIDYYTYALVSDGDLMEGISYEAASLAGHLKLDNLIVLYDSNDVSLDGKLDLAFSEDVCQRFDAAGWYTCIVKNNTHEINRAILRAKKSGLPSFIEVKTTIGEGSILEGTSAVHGKPLTKEDIIQLKQKLGMPNEKFFVDEEALLTFKDQIMTRLKEKYIKWQDDYNNYLLNLKNKEEVNDFYNKIIRVQNNYVEKDAETTIDSNEKILNCLANKTDLLFGGSCDLASSTKTYIKDKEIFSKENYAGSNIFFGVREHAMGGILNGLALSGFLPFGSTFLAFADYLKPAIRISALENLPVTYIFTHDSVNGGKDGPTHQPFDQIPMLRSIPNLTVYRPADFDEVLGAWNAILAYQKPSALILSKQITKNINTSYSNVINGAYVVYDESDKFDAVLVATGSEVATCINIAKSLRGQYNLRVVSMPSVELFLKKPKKYQYEIIPPYAKTIFVEASNQMGLRQFVKHDKYLITINSFGCSGAKEDVLDKLDFTEEKIKEKIRNLL